MEGSSEHDHTVKQEIARHELPPSVEEYTHNLEEQIRLACVGRGASDVRHFFQLAKDGQVSLDALNLVERLLNTLHQTVEKGMLPEAALFHQEQEAWERVLGATVEMATLPAYITSEVQRNLEKSGFVLRYLPSLLPPGTGRTLENIPLDDIFPYFFPNWHDYHTMGFDDYENPAIMRQPSAFYWPDELQETTYADMPGGFPETLGSWVAIEKVPKPNIGSRYIPNPFEKHLGLAASPGERTSLSWHMITNAMQVNQHSILAQLGLPTEKANLRLPEVLEWNLLGNREGWGATNLMEWTNTADTTDESDTETYFTIGRSDAGYVASYHAMERDEKIGYRGIITLQP